MVRANTVAPSCNIYTYQCVGSESVDWWFCRKLMVVVVENMRSEGAEAWFVILFTFRVLR